MIRQRLSLLAALLLAWLAPAAAAPVVTLHTSAGDIVLELSREKAPGTVENFLEYARDGFYDGTLFHRVVGRFVIQGGGFTADYEKKPTRAAIMNEADNGLSNLRGTIAMARTPEPHSATSQFFINLKDNRSLNHHGRTPRAFGYAVFGRVLQGMDVVDEIAALPTGPGGPFKSDVPQVPVLIEQVSIDEPEPSASPQAPVQP